MTQKEDVTPPRVRMLGPLAVVGPDGPVDLGGPKQRLVLAALLVARPHAVPVDRLVDLVWGDSPPSRPEASLQAYVSHLRKALADLATGPTAVVLGPAGYALEVDVSTIDAVRFEQLVADAVQLVERGAPASTALAALDAAHALWAPPLPEHASEPFALAEVARLRGLAAVLDDHRYDVLIATGRAADALPRLEAAVAEDPTHERRWCQLALTRHHLGRPADALRTLADARSALRESAGLEVGPALAQLESDLLQQAPHVQPAVAVRPPESHGAGGEARPFVGRDRELALVLDAVSAARSGGSGAAIVVDGEAGVGKTRLVDEVVRRCRSDGWRVAVSACPESAALDPYAPLSRLLDQVALGGRNAVPGDDPTADFVAWLREVGAPTLLVVDDLQWADAGTLRVIGQHASLLGTRPVLLVATVRTGESPGEPLVDCLVELARVRGALRITLSGLDAAAVGTWVAQALGREADAGLMTVLQERSGGNAFFVQELISLLQSGGNPAGVPSAVQDVVRRRVSRLPGPTQRLLVAASVVGHTFEVDVLAAVTSTPMLEVLDALDPAADASLVRDDPREPGVYRFAHALVAEALLAELSPARRARFHAATLAALRSLRPDSPNRLARVAHHAMLGLAAGTAPDAVDLCTKAARHAASVGAHEDAAAQWGDALRALSIARPSDLGARIELLLALGQAWRDSGHEAAAADVILDAIDAAEAAGDSDSLLTAVRLVQEPSPWQAGDYRVVNRRAVSTFERLLSRMPPGDSILRAEAGSALAAFSYYADAARTDAISAESLAMAERLGDPDTLAHCLLTRFQATWRRGRREEQERVAERYVEVADGHQLAAVQRYVAHFVRWSLRLARGTVGPSELADVRRLAESCTGLGPSMLVDWAETAMLGAQGRHAEAEALAERALERYGRTRRWGVDVIHLGALVVTRTDQGRGAEFLGELGGIDPGGYALVTSIAAAWAATQVGAWDLVEQLLPPRGTVPDLSDDWLWPIGMTMYGIVTAARGDTDAAPAVYDLLSPEAGMVAVAGTSPIGPAVDLALGELAALMGDESRALAHLADAVAIHERLGVTAWLARSLESLFVVGSCSLDPAVREAAQAAGARALDLANRLPLVPVRDCLAARLE